MLTLALVAALAGSTLVGPAPVDASAPPSTTVSPEPGPPPAPPPAGEPPVEPDPSLGGTPPADPAAPGEPDPATGVEPPVDPAAPTDPAVDPSAEASAGAEADPALDADAEASEGDPFALQPPPSPEDPAPGRRRYPPSLYGRGWISAGLGASSRHFAFGVGGIYFVIPWVGVGLDLDDTIVFAPSGYNVFELLPKVVVLALPYRRVTPLVQAGMGGAFFSKGLGNYGRWSAGAGLAMAFGRFSMRGGVDVEGLVPDARFVEKGFACGLLTDNPCSLRLSPWLGFAFGF